MNIRDYLLPSEGVRWETLLSFWVPPLPDRYTIWFVNRFGDVFATTADSTVLRLDLGSGTCREVAQSREHFARLLNIETNAQEWLRIDLVDACRKAGMTPGRYECLGFRIPPTLGGRYELANITPTNLLVHYSYQAYICKQQDIYWIPPSD